METIEKDLNLILDYSTKETSRNIKTLKGLAVMETEVEQSIELLNTLGYLSEGVSFEKGSVNLKGVNYGYSLPYNTLPYMVAGFLQNKTKYRTKSAVLYKARTR
jgi:hypothetical protein